MTCVILLNSIHRVMKAEKLLKRRGLNVDIVPVPREISSDCGVAIEIPVEIEEQAFRILEEDRVAVTECYTHDAGGKFEKKTSCGASVNLLNGGERCV